jgi:hypothetical protein
MKMQRRSHDSHATHTRARSALGLEIALFLLATLLGIYGLGQGLAGLYEQGQQINLLWLAVTGLAFFVLFAQMGRVHDTWPRRPKLNTSPIQDTPTSPSEALPEAHEK